MAPLEPRASLRVTVFASSTTTTAANLTAAASEFGRLCAEAGLAAVFGGGNAGCMGAFYDAMLERGGRVHGITHRMFVKPGGSSLSEENAGELESLEIIEGSDLSVRKRRLLDAGDCLVALPGGVGTFDELFMAITERGVGCGDLPLLILNTDGYYNGVIEQLRRALADGMLRKHWKEYVTVVDTPQDAVAWCLRQEPRSRVATTPSVAAEYRKGMLHGAALATAAAALVMVAAATLRRA